MTTKNMPFDFITDYLTSPAITIKPVFGMFLYFAGGRILLILRQRENDCAHKWNMGCNGNATPQKPAQRDAFTHFFLSMWKRIC